MADPVTLSTLALGGAAGGGVFSAIGQILGTKAKTAQLGYEADVNQKLASIATANANLDFAAGETKALQAGEVAAGTGGRFAAETGMRGFTPGTGSAGRVAGSITAIGQENQAIQRADAAHAAWGEQIQAAEKTAAAGADIAGITNVQRALPVTLAATTATTVGSVDAKWYQLAQQTPSSLPYDDPSTA